MADLHEAADWFKRRKTRIRAWYDDDQGKYAFVVKVDGQQLICCAKDYLHDGDASFMAQKIVLRAIDNEALIMLFVKNKRLVFDPNTIAQEGTEVTAEDSRKQRGERWIDVDAKLSCSFEDWVDGNAEPPTPRSEDEPPREWWDITAWDRDDDGGVFDE